MVTLNSGQFAYKNELLFTDSPFEFVQVPPLIEPFPMVYPLHDFENGPDGGEFVPANPSERL